MEILFEQDNEEKSVATLILDTLVKVQIKYENYTIDTICFLIILLESFSVFGRRARTFFFSTPKRDLLRSLT